MINIDEQIKIVLKGVDEIIGLEELKEKLAKKKELVVKLGLDPSAPDIHLGHTVVLRKLKQLQDLGHRVVIIIGDFTGKIGDPTGKSKTRKALTTKEVMENAKTYESQVLKILDKSKTKIRFNSEWLSNLNFEDVIMLGSKITVARMLEREDFKNRYENQTPILVHEFFYPLMQGFDSVQVEADIELGGTDQRFNVLMGRMLQKEFKQEPQVTIFMPLLEGLDGKNKMSKSLGNYIGINEPSTVMFEKAMTIPDSLITKYYELVTDFHPNEIEKIKLSLYNNSLNPRDLKMELAKEIVRLYHGDKESHIAKKRFIEVFQKGKIPEDITVIKAYTKPFNLANLVVENKLVKSKSEFKRLISQGGIKVNGKKLNSIEDVILAPELILQIGKKIFLKIILD